MGFNENIVFIVLWNQILTKVKKMSHSQPFTKIVRIGCSSDGMLWLNECCLGTMRELSKQINKCYKAVAVPGFSRGGGANPKDGNAKLLF